MQAARLRNVAHALAQAALTPGANSLRVQSFEAGTPAAITSLGLHRGLLMRSTRTQLTRARWEDEFCPPSRPRPPTVEIASPTDPEWVTEFTGPGLRVRPARGTEWPVARTTAPRPYFLLAYLAE